MKITVTCDKCEQPIQVEGAGKPQDRCPNCGKIYWHEMD